MIDKVIAGKALNICFENWWSHTDSNREPLRARQVRYHYAMAPKLLFRSYHSARGF